MAQMIKRRITDALREVPIRNGEYLKGEHMKLVRDVLSAGINANKNDIDLITSGDPNVLSFYTTYHRDTGNMTYTAMENLERYDFEHNLPEGTRVLLYESGDSNNYGLYIAKKVDGVFVSDRLGLVSDTDRLNWDKTSISDVMTGRVEVCAESGALSGLYSIDGIQLKEGDLVLFTGMGVNSGIYEAKPNIWRPITSIKVNQVLSVDSGVSRGGSMYKLTEFGTYALVKKPERSTWIVL